LAFGVLLPAQLSFSYLRNRFVLAEDLLLCKGAFRTKRIYYSSIEGAELYQLPYVNHFRRRQYDRDIGEFYAILYSGRARDGVLIEVDEKVISKFKNSFRVSGRAKLPLSR